MGQHCPVQPIFLVPSYSVSLASPPIGTARRHLIWLQNGAVLFLCFIPAISETWVLYAAGLWLCIGIYILRR
jgi:hypothetical protein